MVVPSRNGCIYLRQKRMARPTTRVSGICFAQGDDPARLTSALYSLIQVVKCLMAAVPALPPSIYTTILPARLALYNSTGFLTFLDPKPPTATTQASLWSALGKTFRIASFLSPASIERVSSLIDFPLTHVQVSTVLTVLSIAPSLIIILYASLSIGQSSPSSTSPPPTIRLLLPALFTFTLGYYLFSTTATPTALPRVLVPLGLVMSLRGGKETGLGENETWELGVLLNNLASVSSVPSSAPSSFWREKSS